MNILFVRLLTIRRLRRPNSWLLSAIWVVLLLAIASMGVDSAAPARAAGFITLTPKELNFGSQSVDTPSQTKTAILKNTAASEVPIRDVTVSGIDFTETNTCQGSLAPAASCTIAVTFKPAITGPRLGTVIISASDPASPYMLVLSGVGQ